MLSLMGQIITDKIFKITIIYIINKSYVGQISWTNTILIKIRGKIIITF
jgi:hypothetical protein